MGGAAGAKEGAVQQWLRQRGGDRQESNKLSENQAKTLSTIERCLLWSVHAIRVDWDVKV